MTIIREPSCEDPTDPELLPVDIAVERMSAQLVPLTETETLPIKDALDRILGADVVSPVNVPSYTNSAMDGYAIRSADIPKSGEIKLGLAGTSWAGVPMTDTVATGYAVRIMTGGMMPHGLDTVVIQEHVQVLDDGITIDSQVEKGRNVRQAGEDVQLGQRILERGEWLGPAQIGLLASLGVSHVDVIRRLKVAYFTTGDELRSLEDHGGEELGPGELFDSNRYTLYGMLMRLNVELLDLGVVRDDPDATRAAFLYAADEADVILTSGGVSAGEADFVTRVFHEIGQVAFWKLAMRPGRPMAFGSINDALFFGLPGNPVAVMVAFYEFVQPALKKLSGATSTESLLVRATCQSTLRKSPGRMEYQRGVLGRDDYGELIVSSTGKQGAGRLSSMCSADCIIVLPPGSDKIVPGDRVDVQPFFGLV